MAVPLFGMAIPGHLNFDKLLSASRAIPKYNGEKVYSTEHHIFLSRWPLSVKQYFSAGSVKVLNR